ncbi:MAG: bifunctional metallophosphatase/5'-nucleotidase [Lachnospiraceae bacterium]|nr:bifunctional metallophosphatase/5'-nucleotidase [Lachnospiraceae bacterium]
MRQRTKRFLSYVLTGALALGIWSSQPAVAEAKEEGSVAILYTNDVHTYIDNPLSYDVIASLKDQLEDSYESVILVDAGDHIQGTAYGSMDKGKTIIELMNAADYDLATLGNHEFDYGMEGCIAIREWAKYPYVSSNFYHEKDGVRGENVLDSYEIFEAGEEKIAFVGITTPESFTKSTPAYFQDEAGNYIYGIGAGEDGSDLQADLQIAIDAAKKEGATKVIALGHLGDDPSSKPWTSEETIAGVSGLDAFIDGHSHSTVEASLVKDKEGKEVLLTQTGYYFGTIGLMTIDTTGAIKTELLEAEEILEPVLNDAGEQEVDEDGNPVTEVVGYTITSELAPYLTYSSDKEVQALKEKWIGEIDTKLGEVIGKTELTFDNYDGETRLVRSQETNTGDFAADALYYLFDNMDLDVDIAIMNGGGIRNKAITGDITYKVCKEIHTFGNVACLQTVTGQQLLDALEWGARTAGTGEENGGFLHVSGMTYKIDGEWPESTQVDDKGVWIGAPTGGYRVHDVQIYNKETNAYEPLELNAKYNMAGYNYTLRDLGDGFNMFSSAVNILDYVMEDYMVLANYVKGFENGAVEASNSPLLAKYPNMLLDYSTTDGSGRIVLEEAVREEVKEEEQEVVQTPETEEEVVEEAPIAEEKNNNTIVYVVLICALAVIIIAFAAKKNKKN